MPMEITNKYGLDYINNVQAEKQEKTEGALKTGEKDSKTGNIPEPKDEYICSEKSGEKPSGLYYMGQDENGNPKVIFDDPEKAKKQDSAQPKEKAAEKAEKTTANTDKVDREIKKLKEEKKRLEQQLQSVRGDEKKTKELEKKIAQIEAELSQKDNDTYRRQHTFFS